MTPFLLIVLCLFSPLSFSQEGAAPKRLVEFTPTIFFANNSVQKGALFWEYPFLMTVVGIRVGDYLSFGDNGGITLYQQITQELKLSTRFQYINANGPPSFAIKFKNRAKNFRNSRKAAVQSDFIFEWKNTFFNTSGQILLGKGLHGFYGYSVEVLLSKKIIPFTSLFLSAGLGDASHNHYYYGHQALSGPSYYDYGVSLFLPFLPWSGICIGSLSFPRITQKENRGGEYTLSSDRPNVLRFILTWKI